MSTQMTEADREGTPESFRPCLPRRGAKDDRLFPETLPFLAVHDITRRALPERFGRWNTAWRRFHRLSRSGVFEGLFTTLADPSDRAHPVRMFDSTAARAPVSAADAREGQQNQALGRSRGGFGTKVRPKTDLDGLPLGFDLTGGQAGDSPHFRTLLDLGPEVRPRAIVADRGYDSAGKSSTRPKVRRPDRHAMPQDDRERTRILRQGLCRAEARIEQAVGRPDRFGRITLRCERTAINFSSFIALAPPSS